MKLAANIIYICAELAICFWLGILRPLLTLAALGAVVIAPVAIPELIFRLLQH